ncbi:MAG: UTP--glucose-1-phosphate uridylyltransferase [Deltaproteobacteria bacterium]|nr:UTP--glucose-1-phosphate uridylyltransferase [Deltaproteobacteria bacterium]
MPDKFSEEMTNRFKPFGERMQTAGLHKIVIESFRHYYNQLIKGESGFVSRLQIDPVDDIPDIEKLEDYSEVGQSAMRKAVIIKLNGGLGTGMGMEKAKSLLEVKNGLSFLDIIARQVLNIRNKYNCKLPLVLMDSFSTQADSLAALETYPELKGSIPLDFLQNKVPKINQNGLNPVSWPQNPELEWCPPGHGDIYIALVTSGMLDTLLEKGYKYAFVSNADNLGAVIDSKILGYFASHNIPFMMEVADRTEADRKGGHLARLKNSNLTLRESAQCPEEEEKEFQDITIYKYFNTNTLWVNLVSLKALLKEKNNMLPLPLIINSKTVDPRDKSSPEVFQLETAMGSAISVFPGAQALRVPRIRFAPVKACVDLLGLWSDAYVLTEDSHVIQNPERSFGQIVIELDPRYYKLFDEMKARFPHGVPSLIDCEKLVVEGDVLFGQNIVIKGNAYITNKGKKQLVIPDGEIIEG